MSTSFDMIRSSPICPAVRVDEHHKADSREIQIMRSPIWNHIRSSFEALTEVFLQVKAYENFHHIGFNGRVVVKTNSFINHSNATFAAVDGIVIKARKITNRGQILTQGEFSHASKHQADLDNRGGVISGQKGIVAHKQRVLLNEHGKLLAGDGSLSVDYDRIDNTKGLLKATTADIQTRHFDNSYGELFIVQNSKITVCNAFDNDHGLIDCGGKFLGVDGDWSNSNGLIKGVEGINIQSIQFANFKGGHLFSPNGDLQILTKDNQQHYGRVDAATGIMLLSQEGIVWATDGTLFTPNGKIAISSSKQYLSLAGLTLEGGALEASAHEQVHLTRAKIHTQEIISIKSETGWIDAQQTDLATHDMTCSAENGYVALESNVSNVDRMTILSEFGHFEASQIDAEKEFVFDGQRFKMRNTGIRVKGDINIHSLKSINVAEGTIQASGQVNETSQEWILGVRQETVANQITRRGSDIHLQASDDEAEKITNRAENTLSQIAYQAEAKNLSCFSGEQALFRNNRLTAKEISMEVHDFWLDKAHMHFENLRIQSEQAVHIHELHAEGHSLSIKAKKKSLSVNNSKIKGNSRYSAGNDLAYTNNASQGLLELTSKQHQHVANNILHKGDIAIKSAEGDADIQNNALLEIGSLEITTSLGATRFLRNEGEVERISSVGKEVVFEEGDIKSKGNASLDAAQTRIRHFMLAAQNISVKGKETHAIDQSNLLAGQNMDILTDGAGLINKCRTQADKIQIKGSHNVSNSIAHAQRQIDATGEDLRFETSQVKVEAGPLSMYGKTIHADQSHFQATTIQEQAVEILSVESHATANGTIERTADNIAQLKGSDHANQIVERAENVLFTSQHEKIALKKIEQTAKQTLLHQNTEIAPSVTLQGEIIQGSQNRFSAEHWHVQGGAIRLPETIAVTQTTNMQAVEEIFVPFSKLEGKNTFTNQSAALNLTGATINGSVDANSGGDILTTAAKLQGSIVNLQSSGDLWGYGMKADVDNGLHVKAKNIYSPGMQLQSKSSSQLTASEHVYLSHSQLHAPDDALVITGDRLSVDHAQIKARSLVESGTHGISAMGGSVQVQEMNQQARSGSINLEGSYTRAQNEIVRNAGFTINHSNAASAANRHLMEADYFDNRNGNLEIGEGTSSLRNKYVYTDMQSRIHGRGSFTVKGVYDYVGNGAVHLGDSFEVQGSGGMTLNHPVEARRVIFDAVQSITNNAPIHIYEQGMFAGDQLLNNSLITSGGSLAISQRQYRDPINVIARENLILSSVNAIVIQNPPPMPGGLTISSDSHVKTKAPLTIGGDLVIQGNGIEFQKPVHVSGRGVFHAGKIHFNRTEAFFGDGVDADVGEFLSDVSTINMIGASRIMCKKFLLKSETESLRNNTARRYTHIPSNFIHHGDLYLNAKAKIVNDASNLFVFGNFVCDGNGELENISHTHIHQSKVKTGSVAKKFCGVKYGSTSVYAFQEHLYIDGEPNIQIRKIFDINLAGTFRNEGVVNAGSIQGRVGNLSNGIAANRGRMPAISLSGFMPGGEIRAADGMQLKIDGLLHNRGFITAGKKSFIHAHELRNERPITHEMQQGVKVKTWGRHSKNNIEIDVLNPGGKISGDELFLSAEAGHNQGGIIEGAKATFIVGGEFLNKPLRLRSVLHLNPGNLAPWNTKKAYSVPTHFMGALINSGGPLEIKLRDQFFNNASDVMAWGDLSVQAGEILQSPEFSSHLSTSKRGFMSGKDLHTIIMRDASIRGMADVRLRSTKGDVRIKGVVGSYLGNVDIESARHLHFSAETMSVDNKEHTTTVTPTTLTSQITTSNAVKTSLPFLFSGKNTTLMAKENIVAEELQVNIQGDLDAEAKEIHTQQHVVELHQRTDGFSMRVDFFGSDAVEAIAGNKSLGATVEALLREDPAVNSLFNLASAKHGYEYAMHGLTAAVHSWNEAGELARAKNRGRLAESVGEHLGITDRDGRFNPEATLHLGAFDKEKRKTLLFDSNFSVGGNLSFKADKQRHRLSMDVEGDATFIGKDIEWNAKVKNITQESSSGGFSIGVGPNGIGLGVNHAESSSSATQYSNVHVSAGKRLTVKADKLSLRGATLKGDIVDVRANECEIESLVDTYHQKRWSASANTSGSMSFSQGSSRSEQVDEVSGLHADSHGSLQVNQLNLIGGAVQKNIAIDAEHIQMKDVQECESNESFSASANVKKIYNAAAGNSSSGASLLGTVIHTKKQQNGVTHALSGAQEKGKTKNQGIGIPIIAFNKKRLQMDLDEMQQAIDNNRKMTPRLAPGQEPVPFASSPKKAQKKIKKPSPIQKPASNNEPLEIALEMPLPTGKPLPDIVDERSGLDAWNRLIKIRQMSNARSIAFALEILSLPIFGVVSAVEFAGESVCNSRPLIRRQCNEIGDSLREKGDFVMSLIHPKVKETVVRLNDYIRTYAANETLYNEQRLGIPRETTEQFHQDILKIGTAGLGAIAIGGIAKVVGFFKKLKISELNREDSRRIDLLLEASRDLPPIGPLKKTTEFKKVVTYPVGYSKVVKGCRPLVPEDLGITSKSFFKKKGFEGRPLNALNDAYISKEGETLKLEFGWTNVSKGESLGNPIPHLLKLAADNNANTLLIQAQIVNERLLLLLTKRYGEPAFDRLSHMHQWRIPVKGKSS